jgi:hypothetical protein
MSKDEAGTLKCIFKPFREICPPDILVHLESLIRVSLGEPVVLSSSGLDEPGELSQ